MIKKSELEKLDLKSKEIIETVHSIFNYIDHENTFENDYFRGMDGWLNMPVIQPDVNLEESDFKEALKYIEWDLDLLNIMLDRTEYLKGLINDRKRKI